MDILEQAFEIIEEIESHANDLDEYDIVGVASHIAALESVEYDFDPRA